MANRAFAPRAFGQTGLRVSPIGLGSSYGLEGRDVERAFERGVNFFLWGSLRRRDFALGLREIAAKDRARAVIAIQTYTRAASLMRFGVDRALRFLKTDYVDFLGFAWWNAPPPDRIVEAALRLKEQGKVRHLMISSHHRPAFVPIIADARYDALMLRYNAAHTGAEREVFPFLERRRVATLSFTATRWGALLNPKMTPSGEAVPSASDCYRFVLSNPNVDVCLSGPKNGAELDEAMRAIELGPMTDDELAWMRRVGAHVRDVASRSPRSLGMRFGDWLSTAFSCAPKQLPAPRA